MRDKLTGLISSQLFLLNAFQFNKINLCVSYRTYKQLDIYHLFEEV